METLNETNKTKISDEHIQEPTDASPKISLNTDKTIRKAASIMLVIVVVSSGIMSWKGLLELGQLAGMEWASFLLPISIDGMLLLGSLQTLHAILGKRKSRYGLLLTMVGVFLSIAGNMYSSWELGILPSSVHAVPPLMLFLSLHGFELIMKHRLVAEGKAQAKAVKRPVTRSKVVNKETVATAKKTPQNGTQGLSEVISKVITPLDGEKLEVMREKLPETASKADKIRVILAENPEATPSVVASILGEEVKTISNTLYRIRKEMAEGEGRSLRAV
ncbi:DUF2637 domain-containing protein [Glutamicibacter ardleyensis]|uniref:DUF2637 domain-containing protein n=1 Tax=Glutamicibacter ardleyensis TaxID=225894 RepID=UPI003FD617AF